MHDVAPMIATIALMLGIGWITKLLSTNRRLDRLARMHNEVQHKILDKFGSTQEMIEYLGTDPGRRLLEAPVVEQASPYGRILGSVQAGLVLLLAGAGLLVVRGMVAVDDETGFVFVGVLGLALGLGFLASALAAHVIAGRYGLIDVRRPGSEL